MVGHARSAESLMDFRTEIVGWYRGAVSSGDPIAGIPEELEWNTILDRGTGSAQEWILELRSD